MDRKASVVWCRMSVLCLTIDWHPCRLFFYFSREGQDSTAARPAHRIRSASKYTHIVSFVLRNKTCDQLYGRDVSQEVSVGENVSLQHTPSPLYISGSPTMQ
jgi:hypothetical protein